MIKLIKSAKKNVPDDKARRALYRDMIRSFQNGDWDTQEECMGMDPEYDAALKAVNR